MKDQPMMEVPQDQFLAGESRLYESSIDTTRSATEQFHTVSQSTDLQKDGILPVLELFGAAGDNAGVLPVQSDASADITIIVKPLVELEESGRREEEIQRPWGVEVHYHNGTIRNEYDNGLVIEVRDGMTIYQMPDHSVSIMLPGGQWVFRKPSEAGVEGIVVDRDGTVQYQYDGWKESIKPDGTTITESDDGWKTESRPDGTFISETPEYKVSVTLPNGEELERAPRDPNPGVDNVEVKADGTVVYTYVDGSVDKIEPDGSRSEFDENGVLKLTYWPAQDLTTHYDANGKPTFAMKGNDMYTYDENGQRHRVDE